MKHCTCIAFLVMISHTLAGVAQLPDTIERFQIGNDLLLTQFDCKTNVDDLHSVAANGLDFSDISETCYILGIESIKDTLAFFERFAR